MARGLRKSGRLQIQLDGKLDDESLQLDKLGHVARVKVGIADSGYLRRTDLRTVGTEQSRPPLPRFDYLYAADQKASSKRGFFCCVSGHV
jgi:hypothetical protein